ncbi:hypothetical protein ACRAQ7_08145 [Erythrobacter sp. W53]|uniref:hypothetical protein n=1 Tax=Erythrobacter sp. W53 TaxID=3425947 RepID=UPI003D766777
MSDRKETNGFDRLDRKIGSAYSRAIAWIILIPGGLLFAYHTLSSETFAITTHWPGLAAAAVLLILARICFKSREGMLSILSDVGTDKKR